jgi:hypothetical protein
LSQASNTNLFLNGGFSSDQRNEGVLVTNFTAASGVNLDTFKDGSQGGAVSVGRQFENNFYLGPLLSILVLFSANQKKWSF